MKHRWRGRLEKMRLRIMKRVTIFISHLYRVNGAEPIEGRKDSLPVILQSLGISTE